ncbi:hypothetical protein GGR55DRAFT_637088 [Xylaria sp. FL0064]|nr:hypothetical protein GGR55DRAFT_637088 [Xylaria sp. FL0064]
MRVSAARWPTSPSSLRRHTPPTPYRVLTLYCIVLHMALSFVIHPSMTYYLGVYDIIILPIPCISCGALEGPPTPPPLPSC